MLIEKVNQPFVLALSLPVTLLYCFRLFFLFNVHLRGCKCYDLRFFELLENSLFLFYFCIFNQQSDGMHADSS